MVDKPTAAETLDQEFLQIRCRVIDIGAALDRIGSGKSAERVLSDPRLVDLQRAVAVLIDGLPDRAERVQKIFSDAYDPSWRKD